MLGHGGLPPSHPRSTFDDDPHNGIRIFIRRHGCCCFFSRILLYFTLTQGLTSPGFIFPRTCFDLFMSHWFSFFLGYKINVDVVNRPCLRIFFCCFPCPIYLILAFVPSTRLHILLRMHDYPRSHTTLL